MLLKILGYGAVTFFALYGFIRFAVYILDFSYDCRILKNKVIYTIVGVKNEEERVEGIARALMWKALVNDTGIADRKLVILDFNSEDATRKIVKRIERKDKGIKLIEKEELLGDIESNL